MDPQTQCCPNPSCPDKGRRGAGTIGIHSQKDSVVTEKLPRTMTAVLLTGHGGFDKLVYRDDVPIPEPGPEEVLIRVGAAGVNNTDINTRIGWYSKGVSQGTGETSTAGFDAAAAGGASWTGAALAFPHIQGADVCGRIVAVGEGVDQARVGQRALVRTMLRSYVGWRPFECWTLGSECDGGFAQYTKAPSVEAYEIESELTDSELASFPCAYSTAENMVHRAGVSRGERVLVTGASGGVGSAAVQLAKRRSAEVIAVAGASKAADVRAIGADRVVARGESVREVLGQASIDVVIDLVVGPGWPELLDVLKRGGRYTVGGAIAGPMVELDVRTLYLKDLSFFGCTFQEDVVFENLVRYIERGEIKPLVAKTYPLKDIVQAQKDFLSKKFVGKLVLVPPEDAPR